MVYDWEKYDFKEGSLVLVDTNIWIKAFPKVADPSAVNPYAAFIGKLVERGVRIGFDVVVAGEFVHAFVHLEQNRHNRLCQIGERTDEFRKFKDFRESPYYKQAVEDALFQLEQILECPNIERVDCPFSQFDLKGIFIRLSTGKIDWNDLLIAENCRSHAWVLATNDGDFIREGIDVVTNNQTLLEKARLIEGQKKEN